MHVGKTHQQLTEKEGRRFSPMKKDMHAYTKHEHAHLDAGAGNGGHGRWVVGSLPLAINQSIDWWAVMGTEQ